LNFENFPVSNVESTNAKKTCKNVGGELKVYTVTDQEIYKYYHDFITAIDYPSHDGFNSYIISSLTKDEVKILLSGVGGDEIFGGYPFYSEIMNARSSMLSYVQGRCFDRLPNRFTRKWRFNCLDIKDAIMLQRCIEPREVVHKRRLIPNEKFNLTKLREFEFQFYLRDTLLRDIDAVSSANGQEVRPVFLDNNLVDFVNNVNESFVFQKNRVKPILVDALADFVPNFISSGKKTGFNMPYANWLNGVLNSRACGDIEKLKEYYSDNGLWENMIAETKKRISNRKAQQRDWAVVVLSSWLCARMDLT